MLDEVRGEQPLDLVLLVKKVYEISSKISDISPENEDKFPPEYVFLKRFLENERWNELVDSEGLAARMGASEVYSFLVTLAGILDTRVALYGKAGTSIGPSMEKVDVNKLYDLLLVIRGKYNDVLPVGEYTDTVLRDLFLLEGNPILIKALGYNGLLDLLLKVSKKYEDKDADTQIDAVGIQRVILSTLQGRSPAGNPNLSDEEISVLADLIKRGVIPKEWVLKTIVEMGRESALLLSALVDFRDLYTRSTEKQAYVSLDSIKELALKVLSLEEDPKAQDSILSKVAKILKIAAKNKDSDFLREIDVDWILAFLERTKGQGAVAISRLSMLIDKDSGLKLLDVLGKEKALELLGIDDPSLLDSRMAFLEFLSQEASGELYAFYNKYVLDEIEKPEMLAFILEEMKDWGPGFDTVVFRFLDEGILREDLDRLAFHSYTRLGRDKAFIYLIKLVLFDSLPREKKEWLAQEFGYGNMKRVIENIKVERSGFDKPVQGDVGRVIDFLLRASVEDARGIKRINPKALILYLVGKKHPLLSDEREDIMEILEMLDAIFTLEGENARVIQDVLNTEADEILDTVSRDKLLDFLRFLYEVAQGSIHLPKGMLENRYIQGISEEFFMSGNMELLDLYSAIDEELARAGRDLVKTFARLFVVRGKIHEWDTDYIELIWGMFVVLDRELKDLTPRNKKDLLNMINNLALFLSGDMDGLYEYLRESGNDVDREEFFKLAKSLYQRVEDSLEEPLSALVLPSLLTMVGRKDGIYSWNGVMKYAFKLIGKVGRDSYYTREVFRKMSRLVLLTEYGASYAIKDIGRHSLPLLEFFMFLFRLSERDGKDFSIDEIKELMAISDRHLITNWEAFLRWRLKRAFAPMDVFLEDRYVIPGEVVEDLFTRLKKEEDLEWVRAWATSVRMYDNGFLYRLARVAPDAYKDLIIALDSRMEDASSEAEDWKSLDGYYVFTDIDIARFPEDVRRKIVQEVAEKIRNGDISLSVYLDKPNYELDRVQALINVLDMSETAKQFISEAVERGDVISLLHRRALVDSPEVVGKALKEILKEKRLNEGMYYFFVKVLERMREKKGDLLLYGSTLGDVLEEVGIGDAPEEWLLGEVLSRDDVEVDAEAIENILKEIKGKQGWAFVKAATEAMVSGGLDNLDALSPLYLTYVIGVLGGNIELPAPEKVNKPDNPKEDQGKGGIIYTQPLRPVEILVFK